MDKQFIKAKKKKLFIQLSISFLPADAADDKLLFHMVIKNA